MESEVAICEDVLAGFNRASGLLQREQSFVVPLWGSDV